MNPQPAPTPDVPEYGETAGIDPRAYRAGTGPVSAVDELAALERQLHQLESSCTHQDPSPQLRESKYAEQSCLHPANEEPTVMPASARREPPEYPARPSALQTQVVADQEPVAATAAMETDGVLHDVQATLDSLAGMANGLSRQRQEMLKVQDALEERRAIAQDRERLLAEWEDRLRMHEQGLQEQKLGVELAAEQNAALLAERSAVLQALAESVESRDRAAIKRAELQEQEQRSLDRLSGQLQGRAKELDERDVAQQRQAAELAVRLRQLVDAKDRFSAIVKGFNETVRFNSALSSISNAVAATEGE
ncbi:hypothetical protein QO207_25255 [Pseudomonas sp. CAN2814]|uniref:hypothetical protein n=1 Tax=Pseudomonas sp. CAN1 TaxID=3046726 RepID=UPI0026483093|nr:hypothetical protein [Pseudomonas sp. CAN1]MDN6859910.1 hypothetical protein [Pseudomonas sp. CAN1]